MPEIQAIICMAEIIFWFQIPIIITSRGLFIALIAVIGPAGPSRAKAVFKNEIPVSEMTPPTNEIKKTSR
jgi:hypothetical protein